VSIPQETLDQIQQRIDIVELVSTHLPLKRAGRNFRALCPFHHEKTPSFMVSPEKQIFHCFGCGEGGDVFRFVMKSERIDFLDAVRSLAEKSGIPLPERSPRDEVRTSEVAKLYDANRLAQIFYRRSLLEQGGGMARQYLAKRGVNEKILELFQVGYAPSSSAFYAYARKQGFSEEVLIRAGLLLKGEDGQCRDRFRQRIVFPITNVKGRVLGFGGRVLDQGMPKYLNSPETEIYSKGRELYGLFHTGKSIREKDIAILVEGYLDLISLYEAGVTPTVATLGTSLTREQARLLKRYTRNIIVVFDPDQAGEAASLRGLDIFLEEDLLVKIVTLPQMDPDEFIRKKGQSAFWKEIQQAKPLIPYRLDRLAKHLSLRTPEGKTRASEEILPSIAKIGNAVLRSEYIRELAERLSVREEDLFDELKKIKIPSWEKKERVSHKREETALPPAEAMLLRVLLEDEKWVAVSKEKLSPDLLVDERARELLKSLYTHHGEGRSKPAARHLSAFQEMVGGGRFSGWAVESFDLLDQEKALTDCIRKIKEEHKLKHLASLKEKIKEAERTQQEDQLKTLMEEFLAVRKGVSLHG